MFYFYELIDLHEVFVKIRNNPQNKYNRIILNAITECIFTNNSYDFNLVRKSIAKIDGLPKEEWDFVFHDNYFVDYFFIKDNAIINALKEIINDILNSITDGNIEKVFDLSNIAESFCIDVVKNGFKIPKPFWEYPVKYYRDKWDKNFLKDI